VDLHYPEPKSRYLAPWRMDPRPAGPLFQGCYAHMGVTDYWRERRHSPEAPAVASLEFSYWRLQNSIAIESLSASGELTEVGDRFVGGLQETLRGWADETVPARITSKADDMVLAQTIRWKMRNWRPSAFELDRVVAAWASGAAPAPEPSGVLRDGAEGEPSGIPGIVGMIRSSVLGDPVPDPAAEALINGRYDAACSMYTLRVTTDPGDKDAWIGWALAARNDPDVAAGLHKRPDLVRELGSAISGIDPATFARWLGKTLRPA
jgi:hypothetical protein